MDKQKLFKDYIKVCTMLSKIVGDTDIISSNGVFLWKYERLFSVCTFDEKCEKDIIPFLYGVFTLNPKFLVTLSENLKLIDIEFEVNNITLKFDSDSANHLFDDKVVLNNIDKIKRDEDKNIIVILSYNEKDSSYGKYISIIKNIEDHAVFDKSMTLDLDQDTISRSENVITIFEDTEYKLRIAKSIFTNIVKKDILSIRVTPFDNTNNLFLVTSTNSKEHCLLVNFSNAIKL